MERRPLTTFVIAIKNLKRRSFRTKALIATVAVLSFIIFCGELLSQSLNLGSDYLEGKMCAEIMVVPRGDAINLQNTLLKGESNTFFMEDNLAGDISSMTYVETLSPQLYIGSLNASCCTVPVQLIGFDPKTDFTIKSWMTNIDSSKLSFGEVVVGSRVNALLGEEIWMFGQPLKVLATLDDTGMGFDTSVFMTLETAKHMIERSEETAVHPTGLKSNQISALFIKLSHGSDTTEATAAIIRKYPQTDVIVLKDMMQNVSRQIKNIRGLTYGIQGFLCIVAILILIITTITMINERKREFGLFLAIGATRNKLGRLLITETLVISAVGALVGIAAGYFIMYEFRMLIAVSLGIPYLKPTIGATFIIALMSLAVSVLTSSFACGCSVIRIGRIETNFMIKEYE